MTPTDRAALLDLIGCTDRNVAALAIIERGTAAGSILNVDFKDAKLRLDRAVDAAWDYGCGATLAPLPANLHTPEHDALRALRFAVRVSSARDAIAASKKLTKTTVSYAWVDAARRFVAIVLPLALEMEALRGQIVKGRRPPTAAQLAERAAREAAKNSMERATCGCCFGDQAVLPNGKIHDHGYTLPRSWMKTRSCYGRRFQPLEVSVDGPRFMVDLLKQAEQTLMSTLTSLDTVTMLRVQRGHETVNGSRVPKFVEITPADREFERVREGRIAETAGQLRACREDRAAFEHVVAEWKPGYKRS
jgi:hypothetical protein